MAWLDGLDLKKDEDTPKLMSDIHNTLNWEVLARYFTARIMIS